MLVSDSPASRWSPACGCAGPSAGHRGVRAALIDEAQLRRIEAAHPPPPPGAGGLVPFGRAEGLCFSSRPDRRFRPRGVSAWPGPSGGRLTIARDIVASDTASPVSAAKAVT